MRSSQALIWEASEASGAPRAATGACFHCGQPVPPGSAWAVTIDGSARRMCCPGCQAVAESICACGLSAFYAYRTAVGDRPETATSELLRELAAYDEPGLSGALIGTEATGARRVHLVLEGVRCAACAWLIEKRLLRLPGVTGCEVNYANREAVVRWDPVTTRLSAILEVVRHLGYRAYPFDAQRRQAGLARERTYYLRRFGVAALFGMQVMMVASALYFDADASGERQTLALLNWLNLAMTLPIVAYAAQPFFAGAWRALRGGRPGMDLSVALGIALAFLGSAWHTWTGRGEVYFDSIAMFVTLLLLGRYLELSVQQRASRLLEGVTRIVPSLVRRIEGSDGGCRLETVPAHTVRPGDRLLVRPGETLTHDGRVAAGDSSVDESVQTGESVPVRKTSGQHVLGGSINVESPLEIEVTAADADSFMARIRALVAEAEAQKPRLAALAARIASWFVVGVLVLALATAVYHGWYAGLPWLPPTVAVLVVSCPCALALATPVALTAAASALLARGIAVLRIDALEDLARVTHVIFDKTGTLTTGRLELVAVTPLGAMSADACLRVAASLEEYSEHPIARALARLIPVDSQLRASAVVNTPGAGVEGTVGGVRYALGALPFVRRYCGAAIDETEPVDTGKRVYLAAAGDPLALFQLSDPLRADAKPTVAYLSEQGIAMTILSGDRPPAVAAVAAALGIQTAHAALRPAEKLARLTALQQRGEVVAVVGDGVNDAPMLAGAHVAITVSNATEHAKLSSDLVLLHEGLAGLIGALRIARQTRRIVRQNFGWALGYNLVALPLAFAGAIAAWLAAFFMSASSLAVTLNAARLLGGRH